MAEDDSSNLFQFEDSHLAFANGGSAPVDITSNPSTNPDDAFQAYFDETSWSYQDTDNTNPAASICPNQPGFMASTWGFNSISQQQPQPIDSQSFMQTPLPSSYPAQPTQHPQPMFGQPSLGLSLLPPIPDSLTPAAQEQLRNIAMPPSLQYKSPKSPSSSGSAASWTKLESSEPPDQDAESSRLHSRKRKLSMNADDEDGEDEDGNPVKKNAHNMIEKRYRTNLNDKIAALRDSVPSLRIISKSARGEDTTEDREELHGLAPAHKLNKATVLSKATEYIRHLEKRNSRLVEEKHAMQTRIAAFEKLFLHGAMNGPIFPSRQHPPTPMHYGSEHQFTHHHVANSQEMAGTTAGMIQHSEDLKRAIPVSMAVTQPYPVSEFQGASSTVLQRQEIRQQRQGGQSRLGKAGPYLGKMMVGSLAGLMLLEAAREEEMSNDTPQGRGLFAVPLQVLKSVASSMEASVAGYHFHKSLKLLLLLGTLIWVFVPSLLVAPDKRMKQISGTLKAAPSLAVSIDVRRRAWLTAIQTVWVPKHDFILEAAALLLKTAKLSLRNAIGIRAYQRLTGLTEEQETARVKAWSIALDSQLAGGDVEINKSRLILTLLASWTLPNTPLRSMLQALHIRVLLWDMNSFTLGIPRAWATKLARSRWLEAHQLNQILVRLTSDSSAKHEDELPDHLAALVELKCDDVLTDEVIQRAYNLAYNLETTQDIKTQIDGMDLVVEDNAIASPLDAVAAWWSTQRLHDIIISTMSNEKVDVVKRGELLSTLMRGTPLGSAAELRASAALAFWATDNRRVQMDACAELLGPDHRANLVHSSASSGERCVARWIFDIRHVLRCAALIDCIEGVQEDSPLPADFSRWLGMIFTPLATSKMSLLGCAAAFEVMERLCTDRDSAETFKQSLESLAGSLRLWIGGAPGSAHGLPYAVRLSTVERCLKILKSLIGMEDDKSYGSMSETEAE